MKTIWLPRQQLPAYLTSSLTTGAGTIPKAMSRDVHLRMCMCVCGCADVSACVVLQWRKNIQKDVWVRYTVRKKGTVSEKKVRFVFLSVHIIMNTHTRVQSPHARLHDYTNIRNVLEVKKTHRTVGGKRLGDSRERECGGERMLREQDRRQCEDGVEGDKHCAGVYRRRHRAIGIATSSLCKR